MSDTNPKNDRLDDEHPEQSPMPGVDATIGFEGTLPSSGTTQQSSFTATKQYLDLAFASVLLRSGKLSERHLVRAMLNWTTHGGKPLSEHLVHEGTIDKEQCREIEALCQREIDRVADDLSLHGSLSLVDQNQFWLDQLDRNGKLSKLLGIADDSMLAPSETQSRMVGARYTLLRKLGQGGLGTVWLARDENLRRYVAVKEITNQLREDPQASAHFRREAEITGRLEHPGIVPIYQFGTDEATGRGFYTMRFLGKRTLQDALVEFHERRESGKHEPMIMHRLLTAFVNVCQAIAHAHSRNVIHRDLKPENIALNSFGQVVLLDWGLAKINDDTGMYEVDGQPEPGDLHNVGSTLAGRVLGTPLYMAPEQAAGRLEEVDHLTDIYGLGGILYAILTGVAPHEAAFENGERKRSAADVFSSILSQKMREPRDIDDDVPAELNAICKKALSAKRYLRYDSASAIAEDVQRYMAGESVTAYEAPVRLRLRRWMAKHPTSAQLLLLMTSLLIIGGAAIAFTARQGKNAVEQTRYQGLVEITREIEANLQFDSQELVQDVRFVTELPLMQAVITSLQESTRDDSDRKDQLGTVPAVSPAISNVGEVSAEEWIERLGSLLDGLLKANPAYLVMSSCEVDDKRISELVRSERFSPTIQPHRVPTGQLTTMAAEEEEKRLETMRPGQVSLITGNLLDEEVPTRNRSALILVALSPVFEQQKGEFFGFNVIELDLRKRLKELLLAVAPENVTVFITDAKGNIALSYKNGESANHNGDRSITSQFEQLGSLFDTTNTEFTADRKLYGTIVTLGSNDTMDSLAKIGIVVRQDED